MKKSKTYFNNMTVCKRYIISLKHFILYLLEIKFINIDNVVYNQYIIITLQLKLEIFFRTADKDDKTISHNEGIPVAIVGILDNFVTRKEQVLFIFCNFQKTLKFAG